MRCGSAGGGGGGSVPCWSERAMAVAPFLPLSFFFWWLQPNELQIDAAVWIRCGVLCGCHIVCSTVYEPLNHSTLPTQHPVHLSV